MSDARDNVAVLYGIVLGASATTLGTAWFGINAAVALMALSTSAALFADALNSPNA